MNIQVLGSGCPTCKKPNDITIQAVKELGISEEVEYLTGEIGISKIIKLGIMSSPVLAINGKPVMIGFTLDNEKVKTLIPKANQIQYLSSY